MKSLPLALVLTVAPFFISASAHAADGRLAWTGGVSDVDGSAGGGLVPWALIAGLGTDDEVGVSGFVTRLGTQRFELAEAGVAIGIADRVELSFAQTRFDIGDIVPNVNLGTRSFGAKVRLAGDAIYDQDRPWPQLAVGLVHRETLDGSGVPRLLGAARAEGTDWYLAATKVYLAGVLGRSMLVNLTVRHSDANQFGLLGFGGKRAADWRPEGTLAVWLTDDWLVGVESREKRGALGAPAEGPARDAFVAFGVSKHLTLVGALADLGVIAGQPRQRGFYGSVAIAW